MQEKIISILKCKTNDEDDGLVERTYCLTEDDIEAWYVL
jgi:hypothetical protein